MKTVTAHRSTKVMFFWLGLACTLLMAGCAVVGTTVPVEQQIQFSGAQEGQGEFKRGRLSVSYDYRMAGSQMELRGNVTFNWSVDSLNVRVLMLDSTGTVLEQKLVYATGFRTSDDKSVQGRTFKETFPVPPGTTGISFSYSSKERSSRQ